VVPFDPYQPVIRWTATRKQLLLEAYTAGIINTENLWLIHAITPAELSEWYRRNGGGGENGRRHLRATDIETLGTRSRDDSVTGKPNNKIGLNKGRKRKPVIVPPDPLAQHGDSTLYKMTVTRLYEPKLLFEFRGPGCRRKMLDWFDMYKHNAQHNGTIAGITVIGTVGNKTDTLLSWKRGQEKAASG